MLQEKGMSRNVPAFRADTVAMERYANIPLLRSSALSPIQVHPATGAVTIISPVNLQGQSKETQRTGTFAFLNTPRLLSNVRLDGLLSY